MRGYHRPHVFPIHVPPLREHSEDIPLLVWYFVQKLQALHHYGNTSLPGSAPGVVCQLPQASDRIR